MLFVTLVHGETDIKMRGKLYAENRTRNVKQQGCLLFSEWVPEEVLHNAASSAGVLLEGEGNAVRRLRLEEGGGGAAAKALACSVGSEDAQAGYRLDDPSR